MTDRIAFDADLAKIKGRMNMHDPADQRRSKMIAEDLARWREAEKIAKIKGQLRPMRADCWEELARTATPRGLQDAEWRQDMERRILLMYERNEKRC